MPEKRLVLSVPNLCVWIAEQDVGTAVAEDDDVEAGHASVA
jgi:hypothetical protein